MTTTLRRTDFSLVTSCSCVRARRSVMSTRRTMEKGINAASGKAFMVSVCLYTDLLCPARGYTHEWTTGMLTKGSISGI